MKKVNVKRRKKESLRANGNSAYREWLHAQPCAVCGFVGATEEAHAKTGGMGRKANAHVTLPLCGPHWMKPNGIGIRFHAFVEGCHRWQHRLGTKAFEARHGVSLLQLAEQTQARWLAAAGSPQTSTGT